jgi:hypothetical protein
VSREPINDWEITGIYFAALPLVPAGAVRASFVERSESSDEQTTLIPAASAEDEGATKPRAIKDDYYGP